MQQTLWTRVLLFLQTRSEPKCALWVTTGIHSLIAVRWSWSLASCDLTHFGVAAHVNKTCRTGHFSFLLLGWGFFSYKKHDFLTLLQSASIPLISDSLWAQFEAGRNILFSWDCFLQYLGLCWKSSVPLVSHCSVWEPLYLGHLHPCACWERLGRK